VPGLQDSGDRRTKIRWGGMDLGSVVGIQIEVADMYTGTMHTGTMISDLMTTVERVEQKAEQRKVAEELHAIFSMQIPVTDSDQIFMGAA
jgi:hypothetical protein